MNQKKDYFAILADWYGYRESNQTDDIIIRLYNSNRTEAYRMSMSDPWCHATISAAAYMADCGSIIPNTAYCPTGIQWFKKRGQWVGRSSSSYSPQSGDILYYDWGGDGISDHVGCVISRSGSILTVREGNYQDTLKDRRIDMYSTLIQGYGRPAWAGSSALPASSKNWLELGSKGTAVTSLQKMLIALGYSCGSAGADGILGRDTRNAVIAFQKANRLSPDGQAGELTLARVNALYKSSSSPKDDWIRRLQAQIGAITDNEAGPETLSKCPVLLYKSQGILVQLVQERLQNHFQITVPGGIDGIFGKGTQAAVMQFQNQHHLEKDGIIGRKTWSKLLEL